MIHHLIRAWLHDEPMHSDAATRIAQVGVRNRVTGLRVKRPTMTADEAEVAGVHDGMDASDQRHETSRTITVATAEATLAFR